jgi:hypothetical protein
MGANHKRPSIGVRTPQDDFQIDGLAQRRAEYVLHDLMVHPAKLAAKVFACRLDSGGASAVSFADQFGQNVNVTAKPFLQFRVAASVHREFSARTSRLQRLQPIPRRLPGTPSDSSRPPSG